MPHSRSTPTLSDTDEEMDEESQISHGLLQAAQPHTQPPPHPTPHPRQSAAASSAHHHARRDESKLIVDEIAHASLAAPLDRLSSQRPSAASTAAGQTRHEASLTQLLSYYIPILSWLPRYDPSVSLLPDTLAGLTVAIMIIPQSIAYASLAGLPPIMGLYTSFFPMLFYGLLGSSRQMSVGPESTTAILLAHTLAKYTAEIHMDPLDPALVPLLIDETFRVTFLSGLLALAMGLLRLGFVDSVLSLPILQGFLFSTALLLITDQFPKLLGLSLSGLNPDAMAGEKWQFNLTRLFQEGAHMPTMVVSLIALSTMASAKLLKARYGARHKWVSSFPDLMIVLLLATMVSHWLQLDSQYGVAVMGQVAYGFVAPRFASLSTGEISELLSPSLSIALIGFVNSGIVSKIFAQKHGYSVSSNRELVALGSANVLSSLMGAFPSYGSVLRSMVADAAGATSPIASLVCASVVGVVIMWLLPLFSMMPKAVISSMIFLVALSLLDLKPIRTIMRIGGKRDGALWVTSVAVTFLLGVDTGILFAFAACLTMLVKETNIPSVTLLGRDANTGAIVKLESEFSESVYNAPGSAAASGSAAGSSAGGSSVQKVPGVLMIRITGSLHFANAASTQRALERIEKFSAAHAHPASKPRPFFTPGRSSYAAHAAAASAEQSQQARSPVRSAAPAIEVAAAAMAPASVSLSPPIAAASHSSSSASSSTASPPSPCVLLDLSGCPSVDSSAVLTLLDVFRSSVARGLRVLLVLHSRAVHYALVHASGADQFISGVFSDVDRALQFALQLQQQAAAEEKSSPPYESFQAADRRGNRSP